jgi:hypothetical protein
MVDLVVGHRDGTACDSISGTARFSEPPSKVIVVADTLRQYHHLLRRRAHW